jgi:hypothetical protein
MSILSRLRQLERTRTAAAACVVCKGIPPTCVRVVDEGTDAPVPGQGVEREPCPGCGGLQVVEIVYADTPPRSP